MLDLNKTYFVIFCLLVVGQLFGPAIFPNVDEIITVLLLGVGLLDMFYNKKYKRYMPLIIPLAVLSFYLIYSLLFCHFNTTTPIVVDFFQHIKTFVFFGVAYAIAPKFNESQKKVIKVLMLAVMVIIIAVYSTLLFDSFIFYDLFEVPYYVGSTFFCAAMTYMMFIDSNEWKLIKKNIFYLIIVALIGLTCGRSKYYGTVVFVLFMMIAYQPGRFAKLSLRNLLIVGSMFVIVLSVAWAKIEFYFLNEQLTINGFDDESLHSFARPALYVGMFLVLMDYPLFGSGFASFGTAPSSPDYNYSLLYQQYGLDKVWGLSIEKSGFIADAFYPGLAQFGLVGVVLFVMCMVWLCKKVKLIHRYVGIVPYIIGVIIIVAILIDAVASRGIASFYGEYLFSIMGIILAPLADLSKEEEKELKKKKVTGSSMWNRVFNRRNKEKLIYGK